MKTICLVTLALALIGKMRCSSNETYSTKIFQLVEVIQNMTISTDENANALNEMNNLLKSAEYLMLRREMKLVMEARTAEKTNTSFTKSASHVDFDERVFSPLNKLRISYGAVHKGLRQTPLNRTLEDSFKANCVNHAPNRSFQELVDIMNPCFNDFHKGNEATSGNESCIFLDEFTTNHRQTKPVILFRDKVFDSCLDFLYFEKVCALFERREPNPQIVKDVKSVIKSTLDFIAASLE